MTAPVRDLALGVLADPSLAARLDRPAWSVLVRQARAAGLLARIALRLGAANDGDGPWPDEARGHIEAALRVTRAQHAEVDRELRHLQRALGDLGAPIVLLKGAAYAVAGLQAAQGRVFSDIDLMVPKSHLLEAESRLLLAGWANHYHSAYDQRYYRQWMHELPPLTHQQRNTTLDVHHTILPETARLKPDAARLFADARPLAGHPGIFVLAPADMVLHSMTHLFMNDDMGHALRDLSDLDLLLREFGTDPSFWTRLPARARELDLERPLFYGLHTVREMLGTPVPAAAWHDASRNAPREPLAGLMRWLWRAVIGVPLESAAPAGRAAALFALYVRGHWLRMPPLLLVRHLTIKALGLHREHKPADAATPTP